MLPCGPTQEIFLTALYWCCTLIMGFTGLIWALNLLQLIVRGVDRNRFRIRANQVPDAPTTGPSVSVLIPARNEENNIGPCIHAVLSQHYTNLESLS